MSDEENGSFLGLGDLPFDGEIRNQCFGNVIDVLRVHTVS